VEIVDRQQIGLARRQPIRRRRALTFWAMAVATRVVSDTAVAAILAALDMPAECGRAALLDCGHDLELTQAHMTGIGSLEQHPIGLILPPMLPEERSSLRNDLVVNGLRVPIVRYEGKILDGWHRYELCVEENIEPRFEEYTGDDPFGFVRSLNLSRRHLTLAQKKEVAKHIFEREPGRTDNSIAKEIGLIST
jgi:hypothetical protein